jgi:hypothetical protein
MESREQADLLKSIHSFFTGENVQKEENENILISYLKNPEIIKDNKTDNLFLFTKELSEQIKNGNNIILPFIDPCYNLIESYINSDNDKINWDDLFKLLIENSYINRIILFPIYAYFSELYSEVDHLTESDEKLVKFTKMTHLWNLLYSYDGKKIKNSFSTFCFMGTGLEILGIDSFINIYLEIKIDFLHNICFEYLNDNDDLIYTEFDQIKYSDLNIFPTNNISSINFIFKENSAEIMVNKEK